MPAYKFGGPSISSLTILTSVPVLIVVAMPDRHVVILRVVCHSIAPIPLGLIHHNISVETPGIGQSPSSGLICVWILAAGNSISSVSCMILTPVGTESS